MCGGGGGTEALTRAAQGAADEARYLATGFDLVMTKPFDVHRMAAVLANARSSRRRHAVVASVRTRDDAVLDMMIRDGRSTS